MAFFLEKADELSLSAHHPFFKEAQDGLVPAGLVSICMHKCAQIMHIYASGVKISNTQQIGLFVTHSST